MKEEAVVTVDSMLEFMGSWRILRIPKETVKPLGLSGNSRRVVCAINGSKPFQCALFPIKKGGYFITASKELRERLKIADGDKVRIEIKRTRANTASLCRANFAKFCARTKRAASFSCSHAGNQLLSIRLVDDSNDGDKRIRRAIILLACLKCAKGKFVWAEISNALKKTIPRFHAD